MSTFLELNEDVGLVPSHLEDPKLGPVENPKAGEHAPFLQMGIQIPVPTMVNGEVVDQPKSVAIVPGEKLDKTLRARIVPNTRCIETDHPAVVELLLNTGKFHEVDQPKADRPHTPKAPSGKEG
jgi:hypothetical protein